MANRPISDKEKREKQKDRMGRKTFKTRASLPSISNSLER
jgi:hypothetical protein